MYNLVQEGPMRQPDRTRRVAAATARQKLSRLLDDVRRAEQPVIIEKSGVPVAAVVPLSMLDRERRWAQERVDRLALLERLRRPFRNVPPEKIERESAAAIAAVRGGRRRKQMSSR
jgi:prevent-host-death family protein